MEAICNYIFNSEYIPHKTERLHYIRRIMDRLNNPQEKFPTLHIAGTNGKGSTSAFLESILRYSGQKTGLFTSPHLVDYRERIKIDNKLISKSELYSSFYKIKDIFEEICKSSDNEEENAAAFFMLTTAIGFDIFAQNNIDIGIIEVGVGGIYDHTNIINPVVGIIAPISVDHVDQLGIDIVEIARNKCGIIKPGMHIVTSMQCEEVMEEIIFTCKQKNAHLYCVEDAEIKILKSEIARQSFSIKYKNKNTLKSNGLNLKIDIDKTFDINMFGEHQIYNAATSVIAANVLKHYLDISDECIGEGLYI